MQMYQWMVVAGLAGGLLSPVLVLGDKTITQSARPTLSISAHQADQQKEQQNRKPVSQVVHSSASAESKSIAVSLVTRPERRTRPLADLLALHSASNLSLGECHCQPSSLLSDP